MCSCVREHFEVQALPWTLPTAWIDYARAKRLSMQLQVDVVLCKHTVERAVLFPLSTNVCVSCPMANIKSLSDLNGEDSDDNRRHNDYYAGGEKR
jgi:hypothetical protein